MANTVELLNCPVCDGKSFRPLPKPNRWIGREVFDAVEGELGLVRCSECGLHFISPRPSGELLDAFYSGDNYSCHTTEGSASAGSKADFLLDQIERTVRPELPKTLLDYGCGGGAFIQHAAARGWKARGFEPGRRGRDACLRAGLDVVGQLEQLPDAQFSVVTLHHVFEHLTDHGAILKGIQRILAPGGVLFIEVPNIQSLRARLSTPFLCRNCGFDERHRGFPIHLCYFDGHTMRRLLERCGWSIVQHFTAGVGIDELCIRPDEISGGSTTAATPAQKPRRLPRVRQLVRNAVLASGLGENLCVFAELKPRGNAQPAGSTDC